MEYKFEQFKVTIKNPTISVARVLDNYNGTAGVDILMYVGSANNKTAQFGVILEGFTYVDEWVKADVETWVTNKLIEYEV